MGRLNAQYEVHVLGTAAAAAHHHRGRYRCHQQHLIHHSRDTKPHGQPKLAKKKKKTAEKGHGEDAGVGEQGGEGGAGRSGATEGGGEDEDKAEEDSDVEAGELSTEAVEESQDSQSMQVHASLPLPITRTLARSHCAVPHSH